VTLSRLANGGRGGGRIVAIVAVRVTCNGRDEAPAQVVAAPPPADARPLCMLLPSATAG
jgi:hypothetical protein